MKIKNESKGIHQRIVTNSSSSKAHLTSSTSSSSSVKGDDFEIKRRIISDDYNDYDEINGDYNNNNNNRSTNSPSSSSSSTYDNHSNHQSTYHLQSKKACSTSDTLIGFIPLILLVAILSCFVFGVFTIIKLAINHAYKEDYD